MGNMLLSLPNRTYFSLPSRACSCPYSFPPRALKRKRLQCENLHFHSMYWEFSGIYRMIRWPPFARRMCRNYFPPNVLPGRLYPRGL